LTKLQQLTFLAHSVVETASTPIVLQAQIAQDADLHSLSEQLLHLHQRATIVASLKTCLCVFHVSVIIF